MGSNSKVIAIETQILEYMFQSPQWGVILKTTYITTNDVRKGFSPHNGGVILKGEKANNDYGKGFSPHDGDSVLKLCKSLMKAS